METLELLIACIPPEYDWLIRSPCAGEEYFAHIMGPRFHLGQDSHTGHGDTAVKALRTALLDLGALPWTP